MPVASFSASSPNSLLAQPSGAGQKLYLRSTASGDTTQTLTIHGNVSGSYASQAVTLLGQREAESTSLFQTLLQAVLSATAAGVVKLFAPGTAATGSIRVDTVPLDGTTLTVGLVGFTQAYTFRSPAAFSITAVAVASLGQGDYFDIAVAGTTYRFWFDIDAAGTGAPSNPGTLTEIDVVTGNTAAQVATALEAAMETAITGFTCAAASAVVTCVKDVLGAATLTFTDGAAAAATGFTYTEHSEGTADATNQIRTGYHTDGVAVTLTNIADYVDRALDAGGTAGTHYGTGTAANLFLSGSAATGICTLIDRIMCARQLAWSVTQSSTHFTIASPAGGVNGTQLANLAVGITQAHNTVNFGSNEALGTANFPANFDFTSNWVQIGGGLCSISLACTTGQNFTYDTATDPAYPRDSGIIIAAATSPEVIPLTEQNVEYLRLRGTNATGSAKNVHAKVVYR